MRRKHLMLFVILLLSVGFASVSTTLGINGNVKIAKNDADFDVRFTKAILDGNDISSASISADGKTITYSDTSNSTGGYDKTLNFEVTNNSEMYDAKASVDCVATLNSSWFNPASSGEMEIAGKTKEKGNVNIKTKRVSVASFNETFVCTLTATAQERTTKAKFKYVPKYFENGNPTTSSTQNYTTLTYPSGSAVGTQAKVFMGLDEDGSQKSVCIVKNGSLECFKNNNWDEEKTHAIEAFSDGECSESNSSQLRCTFGNFRCDLSSSGYVECNDLEASVVCFIITGSAYCYY